MSDVEIAKTAATNGEAEKSITTAVETAEKTMTEVEKMEKMEKLLNEWIATFESPEASFEEKMKVLINIPREIQHDCMTRERADRLFGSVPLEMYQKVFEPAYQEFAQIRPILIHILCFVVQSTSPEVNQKFKPLLENILKAAHPREAKNLMNGMLYNDLAVIVAVWANYKGEGKFVYEALRCTTGHFAGQKDKLEVAEFLLSTRILMNKIFIMAQLEPADSVDKRGWPVAILAIIRKLLREKTEKFTTEMRTLMWEIISVMSRISGIAWFNMDKDFAKLAIHLNHVELQMCLHDPEHMDSIAFGRHLRVLELYTIAICDKEMFDEDGMEVIPQTVGDSTRYLLTFWVECYVNKIKLPDPVNLSIFNFTAFLFMHEELALTDENVRKQIGYVMVENALTVLDECSRGELRGEFAQVFSDIVEKLAYFEKLDDRVPILLIKYLNKIRGTESYEDWKGRVIDCKCSLMDLRGRVDWYSIKSLNDAKELLSDFTEPEQHEIRHVLFPILDKLPKVK